MSTKNRNRKIKYPKVEKGIVYIKSGFNNTIISLAKPNGDVLKQVTPSHLKYEHCRKNTPSAVQESIIAIAKMAIDLFGMKKVDVILNGPGLARDMVHFLTVYKGADSAVLQIESITDNTSMPHNGCRQRREAKK